MASDPLAPWLLELTPVDLSLHTRCGLEALGRLRFGHFAEGL
jgi:hypothetical protein